MAYSKEVITMKKVILVAIFIMMTIITACMSVDTLCKEELAPYAVAVSGLFLLMVDVGIKNSLNYKNFKHRKKMNTKKL